MGRIDDRGARGAVGQVAGEQVVGGRDARAVLELAADVERLADDLQAGHVPAERRRPARRVQNGFPARAVPDREEVGVRVAARVREVAAGIDLAGGHGDGGDAAVGDLRRRRADRAPAAAVPRRDAIRVGNPARVGELAADVERARRHRQRGGDEVQRVGPGRAPVPEVVPAAGAGGRRQRHERADDHGARRRGRAGGGACGPSRGFPSGWLLPSGTRMANGGRPRFRPARRPYASQAHASTAPRRGGRLRLPYRRPEVHRAARRPLRTPLRRPRAVREVLLQTSSGGRTSRGRARPTGWSRPATKSSVSTAASCARATSPTRRTRSARSWSTTSATRSARSRPPAARSSRPSARSARPAGPPTRLTPQAVVFGIWKAA